MVIRISKSEIFNEVEKRSSFEGAMIPERYDSMWANPSRGEILDSYWVEGYTAAVQLLKRYLSGDTIDYDLSQFNRDEVVTITATMPSRYNSLLDGSVATDVKMLIACNILHSWFEVSNPEVAAKYEEESKGYSEDLRVKILYRVDPETELVSASADSQNISEGVEKLAGAKVDDDKISENEDSLSLAQEDEVEICNHDFGMKYPVDDDVVLEQKWNRKCDQ